MHRLQHRLQASPASVVFFILSLPLSISLYNNMLHAKHLPHFLQWPFRSSPSSAPPQLSVVQLGSFTDGAAGLSSYASNPDKAGPSLAPHIAWAKSQLQAPSVNAPPASVPLYLKATAGLRILPPTQQSLILASVRQFLSQSGFLFKDSNARVISGEEEGAFGWVAVNYLKNTLTGEPGQTFGALDMGGASTQITFAPQDEILSSFFPMYLNGRFFPLYTHSYLEFGLNEMVRKINEAASTGPIVAGFVPNPCYNRGTLVNFTTASGSVVHFSGSSSPDSCNALIQPLLLTDSAAFPCLYPTQCAIEGTYQPRLGSSKFVGFSNFAAVFADTLGLPVNAPISLLRSTMTSVCAKTMDELRIEYPNAGKYLFVQCISGSYLVNLLSSAYHFANDSTLISFQTSSESKVDFGWAMGAMLFEENLLPWKIDSTQWTAAAIGLGIAGIVLFLLVVVTLLYFRSRLLDSSLHAASAGMIESTHSANYRSLDSPRAIV